MIQEYRNIINSINDGMGEKAERYILLVGYLIIGNPIYCFLLLLHICFAGLKPGDYDIATTFLPLFSLSGLLTYLSIFSSSIGFLEFSLFLGQMVSLYVLLVLLLDMIGKGEWSQKICFKLIPIKESLYSREFSNKQSDKSKKGEHIEND